jgi:hypothetical protein
MTLQRASIRRLIAVAGLAAAMLGGAVLGAADASAGTPPPLAIEMQVSPGGTEAKVFVRPTNAELIAVTHSVRRVNTGGGTVVNPPRLPIRDVAAIPPLVATTGGLPTLAQYVKQYEATVKGLQSNTAYEVTVNASTQDGRTASARQTFTTLKQRLSVEVERIVVHETGDGALSGIFGDTNADPTWHWTIEGHSGGPLQDCFPKAAGSCKEGDFGADDRVSILPSCTRGDRDHRSCTYVYVFAQENFVAADNTNAPPGSEDFTTMPTQLTIRVDAKEHDVTFFGAVDAAISTLFTWGAWLAGSSQATWQAPQGVENASKQVSVSADDGGFRSTVHVTFKLFHDNKDYPPNDGRVRAGSK